MTSCLCIITLIVVSTATIANAGSDRIPRVGLLFSFSSGVNSDRIAAFRTGMRDLGYIEGNNIRIDYRHADGRPDRLKDLAAELIAGKVDVIVSGGPAVTRPLKDATNTIPIVMAQDNDPIGNKFVGSLARPGGNITGLSTLAPEISGKRLEILKEVLAKISRVAVFGSSTFPGNAQMLKETENAGGGFGVHVDYLDVRNSGELETAFRDSIRKHSDAGLVLANAIIFSERKRVASLAVKNRLPVIFPQSEYVDDGGLMSYAPNYPDLFRRAATYVDKILKGSRAADLPVEQATKFELIVSLKAARQIGLTIPPNVLARADRVIR
ncbi:MAG TPA: ABC transporter substrate-binding protein [Candidatus Binatia bacterium]